jgi:hypothetical protein
MRTNKTMIAGFGALIVLLLAAIGTVWLGNASIAPPTQSIHQTIPDDRIPH